MALSSHPAYSAANASQFLPCGSPKSCLYHARGAHAADRIRMPVSRRYRHLRAFKVSEQPKPLVALIPLVNAKRTVPSPRFSEKVPAGAVKIT
jgi:hypothetical protein